MPAITSKVARRKTTPIANLHDDEAWQRVFMLMGFKPLNALESTVITDMASADLTHTHLSAPILDPQVPAKKKLTIVDLPAETQKEIWKHASSTDLIALSLVSKHFRDLAAAQLYRNFHIVFPDEDDHSYESPIDGLAGGLDTFVTSDYDYARYLKEIVLDTLSGGSKGERAYRHYTADLSCGKFMNTLLLLTLRKAKALEKFKWDLRVELSRPVFKALHSIPALQHVHIRMQAGLSIYEAPPPLPSLDDLSDSSSNHTATSNWTATGLTPKSYTHGKHKSGTKAKLLDSSKCDPSPSKVPPTLSGFKNLRSISVLDMDSLEYVAEIKGCIGASSSTLNKLKLSFSEHLARQARKPPPTEDPGDESDQELDEFGNIMPPAPPQPLPSASDDATGPAAAFRAQEKKKSQEAVLGRIFGIESLSTKKTDEVVVIEGDVEEKEDDGDQDAGKRFIRDLTALSEKLMSSVNGTGTRTQQQKDALDIIEKAAKKYVDSSKEDGKEKAVKGDLDGALSEASSTAKATPISSNPGANDKLEDGSNTDINVGEQQSTEKLLGMFDDHEKLDRKANQGTGQEVDPDDINVDEPEPEPEPEADSKEFDESLPSEPDSPLPPGQSLDRHTPLKSKAKDRSETTSELKSLVSLHPELEAQLENYSKLVVTLGALTAEIEKLHHRALNTDVNSLADSTQDALKELSAETEKLRAKANSVRAQLNTVQADVSDLQARFSDLPEHVKDKEVSLMSDYIRRTRGLSLRTLAIYLIPIKASVLSKAIDLQVLRRITLLNVGPQTPFWNLLAKENKITPLPLRKIHTDNVTIPFLKTVSQLESLTELFLLERSTKVPEYSFALKTTVSIENIRRMVLKRHTGTLKKLMIKNENDYTWDANEQTIKLLCKRGKLLEELAVSFGVRAVHTFNQYLPGLVNLRAMHIINFRNDDTCHWVIREIRKFAVDSVSHHPEMKLEYIALENSVERLVRRVRKPKANTKGKDKGKAVDKGKSTAVPPIGSVANAYPTIANMLDVQEADTVSSEDESGCGGSDDDMGPGLKLETLEGVRFYDVYGVRMWRKDIMHGRV